MWVRVSVKTEGGSRRSDALTLGDWAAKEGQVCQRELDRTRFIRRITLFADKRQRPRKDVHKVGQPVRVLTCVKLADVEHVGLVLEDSALVTINVEVVGRGED